MLSLDVVSQLRQILDANRDNDNGLWNQFRHLGTADQFDKSKALLQINPGWPYFENCFRYVMAREVLNAICYEQCEDYDRLAIKISTALHHSFPDHNWQVIVGSFSFLSPFRRYISFCVAGLQITIVNPNMKK